MRLPIDTSIVVLTCLAASLALVAYLKDGWPFVGVRVLSSIAFPVLAGWLTVFRQD